MIVVSACLAGLKVRYNGSHRLDQRIEELVEEERQSQFVLSCLAAFPRQDLPRKSLAETDMMYYRASPP